MIKINILLQIRQPLLRIRQYREAVVILRVLALADDLDRDFLDLDIGREAEILRDRARHDEETLIRAEVPRGDTVDRILIDETGRDVDEVPLRRVAVPYEIAPAGCVGEVFDLAEGTHEHLAVHIRIDHISPAIVPCEHRRTELEESIPAASSPADRLRDTAHVRAVDHTIESYLRVGVGVVAELDTDPTTTHLVGDRRRRAGAEEGIEDEVAGLRS